MSPQWFDFVYGFYEGFAVVRLNGQCNFLTREGQILSPQWFDNASDFYKGFARVVLNGRHYSLNKDGELT